MTKPVVLTDEIKNTILDRIACGESLSMICRDDDMPDRELLYRMMRRPDEASQRFRAAYEVAVIDRLFALFEQTLEIADDASGDWERRTREDGSEYVALNPDAINRARLRVQTRMWHLERLRPHVYGKATRLSADQGGGVVILQPIMFDPRTAEPIVPKTIPGRVTEKAVVIDIDAEEI